MKKVKYLILTFILSIFLFSNTKTLAATTTVESILNNYNCVFWVFKPNGSGTSGYWNLYYLPSGYNSLSLTYIYEYSYGTQYRSTNYEDIYYLYSEDSNVVPTNSGSIDYISLQYTTSVTLFQNTSIVVLKGSISGAENITYDEYNSSNDSWILEAWNVFKDYMSGEPFHWIKSLGDFWSNRFTNLRGFWNNIFHKDYNGDIQQDMNIVSPTPLPPTPSPIPYSTIVVFDSNTNSYIYKYEYTDNNNNTIIATSPPEKPNSGSGNGENIKDDYYPSDPLDVPKNNGMWSPQFTINLGDGESLDIDLNTMNDTLIQGAEPYLDDIDASTDLFGAIPQDWFFLIGFCAIIPLICGIINRFLG